MLQLATSGRNSRGSYLSWAIFYFVRGFGKLNGPLTPGPERLLCSEICGTGRKLIVIGGKDVAEDTVGKIDTRLSEALGLAEIDSLLSIFFSTDSFRLD